MSCPLDSGYEAVGPGQEAALSTLALGTVCLPMGSAGSPVCAGRSQDLITYEPITVK